jgi:putative PEP-CTERM system histidine kinase
MQTTIGFYSYLFPAVAFLFLTTLLVISWRGRAIAALVVLASASSALWSALMAADQAGFPVSNLALVLSELLRTGSWCLFLYALVNPEGDIGGLRIGSTPWVIGITAAGIQFIFPLVAPSLGLPSSLVRDSALIVWVAFAVIALFLVEQIYRNASVDERPSIKYLCISLGAIFAYDFYMYADALLVKNINPQLWNARGVINALAVPMLAISVARNPGWNLHIHVSRHVVFHSFTLMGAGLYLILMAVSGYFIRFYGGEWGGVIQVVFLCLAGALLLILLFSDRIRAQTRVLLSKHFFSYKYDYRQEWTRFTDNLSTSDATVPHRIVMALANLVHSNSGALWLRNDDIFELLETWNMPPPGVAPDKLESVALFAERRQWVIDIPEYRRQPAMYGDLSVPEALLEAGNAWLIIPLFFGERVIGLALLGAPEVIHSMNWEDHDLLKVAGRQAASELAQYQINRELVQARQFEAFNRLSAYVVHDLKNILAQQSLIVSNAEKHKHNPAFVDDVIATVQNSVVRMTRLMEQMRSGMRENSAQDVEIGGLLKEVVTRHSAREPRPALSINGRRMTLPADREQLATVFGHIIQNAQDACGKSGEVAVRLDCEEEKLAVICVRDNGVGMDEEFIRQRLFTPFDSTKGLTGMGVGAFESREYIRSLGGEIEVSSTPGVGSEFCIVIPCHPEDAGEQ